MSHPPIFFGKHWDKWHSSKNGRSDIIIPIMGVPKAGKSYFIRAIQRHTSVEEDVEVGSRLSPCTRELRPVVVEGLASKYPTLGERRITLVDTPGFGDSRDLDYAILQLRIASWLETLCQNGDALGGVIYIHAISRDGYSRTDQQSQDLFNELCGINSLTKVVLVTSKWGSEAGKEDIRFEARENELKEGIWKDMVGAGARIMRFGHGEDEGRSALSIVDSLVEKVAHPDSQALLAEVLQIQDELVKHKKVLAQTKLRNQLEEIFEEQQNLLHYKAEAARARGDREAQVEVKAEFEQLWELAVQVEPLRISLRQRLRSFMRRHFGFWP